MAIPVATVKGTSQETRRRAHKFHQLNNKNEGQLSKKVNAIMINNNNNKSLISATAGNPLSGNCAAGQHTIGLTFRLSFYPSLGVAGLN